MNDRQQTRALRTTAEGWQREERQAHADAHMPAGSRANKKERICEPRATSVPAHRLQDRLCVLQRPLLPSLPANTQTKHLGMTHYQTSFVHSRI